MREVKSKSRTSRTGVTRRKNGKSAVAPGKRRNTAQTRIFGKRKTPPKGPVAARLYALTQGEVPMRPFTVGAGVLIVGVVLYGLFVGGHVAAAGRAVTALGEKRHGHPASARCDPARHRGAQDLRHLAARRISFRCGPGRYADHG